MTRKRPSPGQDKPDAEAFGHSLGPGLGINLLVTDVEAAVRFHSDVLNTDIIYWDQDFAIVSSLGSIWMLHHDRTYRNHPLSGIASGSDGRGAGLELRLYGCDPDEAEMRARGCDAVVLAGAADKPHGLREAYIIDPEGYVWVPSVQKTG